jgi:hypothetical protein
LAVILPFTDVLGFIGPGEGALAVLCAVLYFSNIRIAISLGF